MGESPRARQRRRQRVWDKTGGRCWYCGVQTRQLPSDSWLYAAYEFDGFTIDHALPLVRDGKRTIDNEVPCCYRCNLSKKSKTVEEFRLYWARLAGVVLFSPEQIAYLNELGITLPMPTLPTFYFERCVTP